MSWPTEYTESTEVPNQIIEIHPFAPKIIIPIFNVF